VFASAAQLVELGPVLARLPVPLVVDHLARIDPPRAVGGEAFATLRRLLDAGRTWVKLSGAYMGSAEGAPAYGDRAPLGHALLAAAPERLVWGSDWPHTTEPAGSVDDADLVDLLRDWCDDDRLMDAILVDNPAVLYGFDDPTSLS
jgi:predicted TIM-barrel fold metal-dependent hydrolase